MTKKIEDKSSNAESITDIIPEETLEKIFTDLVSKDSSSRQSKFFLYWLFGYPQKVCAKKVGYTESYASKLVSNYRNKPKLRRRVDEILSIFPERYRAVCKMRLPQVAEIEGKALDLYEKKPKLAIDKPQLLKQLKMGGGVDLSESDTPKSTTINIKTIEKVQIAMNDMLKQRLLKHQDTDDTKQ